MFEMMDQEASLAKMKRLRSLRLPYSANQILGTSLAQLHTSTVSRAWTLPPTHFSDEIQHYSARHKALGLKGPRPILRQSLELKFAEELALKIDAGINFLDLAQTADPLVKPILLYYSCAHLCGVYPRAFFEWQQDNRTHGLTCTHRPGKVGDTVVTIAQTGQFPRVVTTSFLLSGMPNCFSELVTYSSTPSAHTGSGELLERFGKTEKGSPIPKLTLDEIVNFDYGKNLKAVRAQHGYHKFKGLPGTAFAVDVIALFVSSSLARYDVLGWREILEGRSNSYRIYFEETFERYQSYAVHYLLAMLEDPFFSFDARIVSSRPSPYSHDDKSRFRDDPNCAN